MKSEAQNSPQHGASTGMLMGMAAILAWATSASCAVWIGRQVGVWQYLAVSSLIGCIGQVAFYWIMGRRPQSLFVLPPRLWAMVTLGFVVYSACYATGMITAVSDAQAVGVGLLNHMWPILMVIFAVLLVPGTRISARLGLALVLTISGLLIANWHTILQTSASGAALPYLFGSLAGVAWGLYSAILARWREWGQHHATGPAGFMMIGAVGVAGCIITGAWQPVDARTWLAFIYLGLIPNAAGYMLWELALHRVPAATLGLMGSATPVLSTLCLLTVFALTGQLRALPAHWEALLLGATLVTASIMMVSIKSAGRTQRLSDATSKLYNSAK
ncbi:MAG: DMT family transporter [bacterium]